MLLSTLAKCCIGVFTTGVVVAVPVLVTTKPWSSTTSQVANEGQTTTHNRSINPKTTNLRETAPTSQAQLDKDKTFDDCVGDNIKFRVGNEWISDKDYVSSIHGPFSEISYESNKCSREVPPKP